MRADAEIRAVIFDCDGTLVDSEGLTYLAMRDQALRAGVRFTEAEAVAELRGHGMATCLAWLERRLGRPLPPDFEARVREAMGEAFRASLKPMPDADWILDQLHVPFCVATNALRSKSELVLQLAGLWDRCEGRLVSAYEVGAFKPDPGVYLEAARLLGVAPSQCAAVEDSVPGWRSALAAGMRVYAVGSADLLPPDLRAEVLVLPRLADLAREPWNQR